MKKLGYLKDLRRLLEHFSFKEFVTATSKNISEIVQIKISSPENKHMANKVFVYYFLCDTFDIKTSLNLNDWLMKMNTEDFDNNKFYNEYYKLWNALQIEIKEGLATSFIKKKKSEQPDRREKQGNQFDPLQKPFTRDKYRGPIVTKL